MPVSGKCVLRWDPHATKLKTRFGDGALLTSPKMDERADFIGRRAVNSGQTTRAASGFVTLYGALGGT